MKMEITESHLRMEKYKKRGIPYCNRSFSCLQVKLKMPQFTCLTLQPLFEACPELEVIIAEKAKYLFYQKMIQLQKFLLSCHFGAPSHIFKGLEIIQETFVYQEKPVGFLKAKINMAHCTLDREKIMELYDYGMIDSIIFNHPEETYYFGEKVQIVTGNITTSKTVQAQFYSIPLKSYGSTEEPAKHEIFVVPIREARHPLSPPRDLDFIDDMEFYLFIETEERRKFEHLWFNFNLMIERKTLQI